MKVKSDITRPGTSPPFLFTPANKSGLDINDTDVGPAGVMALPARSGPVPNLLVSNAKDGSMFLLNRDEEKVRVEGALSSAPFVFVKLS